MNPERWALVDRLLQSSLPLSRADRKAFLRSRCNSDDELYREIESLLEAHDKATKFLENTAVEVEAQAMATSTVRIDVGAQFGPYRVVSRLGTGGLGDVYRAHDPLLERDVAIKLLTGDFADDQVGFQRARQEARAASALNHPNILTIHEIGESDGTPYIVSEYVEGRTLRARIRDGLMPLPRALDIAVQIASALAAAHKSGIVHGDIKPENVMIRPDGLVKVLDFGLASPDGELVGNGSSRGAIAGTPAYMSPEQASGQDVDTRTDIFSLGVMLAEMLSGSVPSLAPHSSKEAQKILARMVKTDRDERYSSADQLHADLKELRDSLGRRRLHRLTVGALVMLGAVTIGMVGIWLARSSPAASPPVAKLTPITSNNRAVAAAISPEGAHVAYVTQETDGAVVRLREVDTGRDVVISSGSATEYVSLAFSRDGRSLYYVARDDINPPYALYQTGPPGKNPKRVTAGFVSGIAFSPDGDRVAFVRARPPGEYVLTVANADGSGERPLLARRMGRDTIGQHLSWSPDGRTIVITAGDAGHPPFATLIAVNVGDGTEKPIPVRSGQLFRSLAWTTDGRGIVVSALDRGHDSGYQLWNLTYPDGTQTKITNDLQSYQGISFAADSRAFVALQDSAEVSVWTGHSDDRFQATRVAATTGNDDGQYGLAWTPNGQIVYTSTSGNATDLWIMDANGSGRRPLTRGTARNLSPTVSPDGRYVVFVSNRGGAFAIWRMSLDRGDAKFLTTANATSRPRLSPDGRWVVYHQVTTTSGPPTSWKISIDGGTARPIRDGHARYPVVSSDGTRVAYSFIDPSESRPGPKIAIVDFESGALITTLDAPTLQVDWMPDGKALCFVRTERAASNIWVQPLDGGAAAPVTAFDSEQIHQLDWSRDGRVAMSRGTTNRDVVMVSGFR